MDNCLFVSVLSGLCPWTERRGWDTSITYISEYRAGKRNWSEPRTQIDISKYSIILHIQLSTLLVILPHFYGKLTLTPGHNVCRQRWKIPGRNICQGVRESYSESREFSADISKIGYLVPPALQNQKYPRLTTGIAVVPLILTLANRDN